MNRTDRLLSIVMELQRQRIVTADTLAKKYETCKRTIYRDMQALCESGVPILSVPGQGYSLMEGYFLPPIHLKPEEAVTLLLGNDYVEQNLHNPFRIHAQSAKEKLEAILPAEQKQKVKELRGTFRFLSTSFSHNTFEFKQEQKISTLQESIEKQIGISFYYRKPNQAETQKEKRVVHPYGLVNISGLWYLVAYCLLRKQIRHFRLDRMNDLIQEKETFTKPQNFYLLEYTPENNRTVTVHLVFQHSVFHKVIETRYFYMDTYELKEDGLHVFLKVRQLDEIFQWAFSWGSKVKVLEPPLLAERIKEEAKNILDM
ncbi:helix-turn-helix transcriptional regulator [Bacillus sp. S14(2024)]|uniref:helix-turn-helix transcriptional regulator n=1 Tax=Bacillus sp. S14(2024) TaxID=3162884 RepID=UPI003D19E37E